MNSIIEMFIDFKAMADSSGDEMDSTYFRSERFEKIIHPACTSLEAE